MPTLTVYAGINGAGKSTLYYEAMQNDYAEDLGTRINLDETVVEMGGDWRNFRDTLNASKEVLEEIDYCIENRLSFNWELTIITPFVLKILNKAKEQGFTINLNFIGVQDLNLSLERIRKRVEQGGHGVNENTVKFRHRFQFKNLKTVLKLVNYAILYDNSKNSLEVAATYFDKTLHVYKVTKWIPELLKYNNLNLKLDKGIKLNDLLEQIDASEITSVVIDNKKD